MKKILGISLVAVLTAAPMMASADPVPGAPTKYDGQTPAAVTAGVEPEFALIEANSETDKNAASAGYVKGAYNAAIKAINKVNANTKTAAGNGLTKAGNTISANLTDKGGLRLDGETDGSKTLGVNTGNGLQKNSTDGAVEVKAKDGSIVVDANGVSVGLTTNGGVVKNATNNTLELKVDNGTVEVDATNGLQVKSGGINTTQLAGSAVTTDKINGKAVTTAKIDDGAVTTTQIADGTITTTDVNDDAMAKGVANGALNNKLTTKDYVDEHLASATNDMATQTGVVQTIKATTITSTASNDFEVANGTVTGSVVIPIMNDWSNPNTASQTGLTSTNVSLALSSRVVNGGTVTTTINPSSVSYNTVDCNDSQNANNAACKSN